MQRKASMAMPMSHKASKSMKAKKNRVRAGSMAEPINKLLEEPKTPLEDA